MPGSLLPAALLDPGKKRVVAVRVASHPHPNAGENWLEDAAAARTTVWMGFSLWGLRVDRWRLEGFGQQ